MGSSLRALRLVPLAFLLAIILGALLLMLPTARTTEASPVLPAFFTSVSSVCVTGLITMDTATYWAPFGQAIILVLIQIGGFGIMSLATLLGVLVSGKLGLRSMLTAQTETHSLNPGGVRTVLTRVALTMGPFEAVLAASTPVARTRGRAKVDVMTDTAATRFATMGSRLRLPPAEGLRKRRRWSGLALTAAALPLLTLILVPLRDTLGPESALLLYLLVVLVVAVVGGIWPAAAASVAALLLANFFFTSPYHTLVVSERDSLIALVVFLLVAATVSITVDLAIRGRVAAARSSTEASMLSRFTAEPVGDISVQAVLEQVHHAFGLHAVALLHHDGDHEQVVAAAGLPVGAQPTVSVPAGGGLRLVADGHQMLGEDRRLLGRLASTAARIWEGQTLAEEAARARELVEIDRLRTVLLAAVGHDLRTPLAGIKAAVTSLQQHDVTWSPADQDELLATIEESANRLDDLIANLLAMSRLQAGAMSAAPTPVALDEVVARALLSLHRDNVVVDVPDDLPLVNADAGLLERAIANVVTNACQFSPHGHPVRIHAHPDPDSLVRLTVSDRGPGVPATDWERMFTPFQRLGETSDGGHGLGLAIARGFTEATAVALIPSETPGGGLTMTFTLPATP